MASAMESSLISKLETEDFKDIYLLFSDYLRPFSDLKCPKKSKKSTKSDDNMYPIRSLAKRFLSFLNRSLSILPKLLAEPSKLGSDELLASELFSVYKLCLDCLESVSSQLSCKPYAVHNQKLRMAHCLMGCRRYNEAEVEGFRILDSLRGVNVGTRLAKSERRIVPDVNKSTGDSEFGSLVFEIVIILVGCGAMDQRKDIEVYKRILNIVEEVRPWYRVIDDIAYGKMHKTLLMYMGKCALFLVGELTYFCGELSALFCLTTLREYAMSSMKDQVYKFSGRICSSLFSSPQSSSLLVMNIIVQVLDAVANGSEIKTKNTVDFLQLVSYCVNKCQSASVDFGATLARYLEEISGNIHKAMSPFELILSLYAVGLKFTLSFLKSEMHDYVVGTLLEDGDTQKLNALLSLLRNYFHGRCNSHAGSGQFYSQLTSDCGACIQFAHSMDKSMLICYFDALEVLCQQLAGIVNRGRKQIITKDEPLSDTKFCEISDAFFQFCDLFFSCQSCSLGEEIDYKNKDTILGVALAAFTISLKTDSNVKGSVHFIKHIIKSEWIQPRGLQHLYTSLNNIAVILYRNKQLKEASKSLKLYCTASWTSVVRLCGMCSMKNSSDNDLSGNDIASNVNDTITRAIFLVDVVHQCGNKSVEKIIIESFEHWSVAKSLFSGLPVPASLIKQWVKTVCKNNRDVDLEVCGQTLHCLLSSSTKLSKTTIGLLLEQELDEYEELSSQYPQICQKMQMKIINILMREVYVTPDSRLQKAILMIEKARVLRVYGSVVMEDCIHCLSKAISLINETYGETSSHAILPCHQLAVAYCLRALCTQEAKSNSKLLFQDINAALNIWLSIVSSDHSSDENCKVEVEYMMLLLYNAIDLLSSKGFLDFHQDMYCLMIRVFKQKMVPLEKFLVIFWRSRRMSHGLCISPVNEAFMMTLSQHLGELPKSINFWTLCLRESRAMLGALQQNFSFFCENNTQGACNNESSFQLDMTVDEVKEAASELISTLPASDHSVFLAGSLYYSLCERLISNGRLLEALHCAKDAHRLHTKLFQKKFIYSVEQKNEKCNKAGNIIQKVTYDLTNLQVYGSALHEVWSFNNISWDFDGYLSPWNVLQSYLESTLQVGIIHERIGNSAEAETVLLWGKSISCLQGLPLFITSFSTVLGKLYQKKQLWDLAEKELHNAKQILSESENMFSCLNCRLTLDVTVDQHLGDLFQSNVDINTTNLSAERLVHSEEFYRSALDKLNLSTWKNSFHHVEEESEKDCASVCTIHTGARKGEGRGSKAKMGTKNCRKTATARKALQKERTVILENKTRVTRSKCQPSKKECVINCMEEQVCCTKHLIGQNVFDCSNTVRQNNMPLEVNKWVAACGCGELSSRCNDVRCWHCLCMEVMISGSIDNFIKLKWEFIRRRLLVRLLIGLGTCSGKQGKIHETHEIILKGLSALASKTLYDNVSSSVQPAFLLELVGKEIQEDVFAVERSELLYITCWFSLKSYRSNDKRLICCDLSQVQLPTLISWLTLAFVLCREVPTVVQKVSRLLAIIHVTLSSDSFYSPSVDSTLSESHWASYFHQASLGTHLNYQFYSNITERQRVHDLDEDEGFYISSSTCTEEKTFNLLRTAPESTRDLGEFVMKFFQGLPCTTIICITLLGQNYSSLLHDLHIFPSCVRSFMLLSRFNSKNQPLVMVLPVDTLLEESPEEDDSKSGFDTLSEEKDSDKHWQCPWGFSVVDNVVPAFKMILKENYVSSSLFPLEDSKRSRMLWWSRRKNLDDCLGKLLRTIEDSWLGPWRIMLLGDWSSQTTLDSVHKKLVRELKLKAKIDVNESLLRVILGGSKDGVKVEAFISQLCSKKGCYVSRLECSDEGKEFGTLHPASSEIKKTSALALELICEAMYQLEEDEGNKEPIILVLDYEVQMLPWENIPILRNQEVYRMPSVGSISMMFDGRHHHQEQDNRISFPLIDPLDAFYLVNPSGDLSGTQEEFENWFKDQHWEGKAGSAPTAEELAVFLKSHDLFIYFGHGSGAQYIPRHEIQKLKKCAATLLMGCSSGSLTLNGCYVPQGTPLSYLQAGSPFIVANLWEVTDKDIDRFGKAMLDAWLRERSNLSAGFCSQCNLVSRELEALKIGSKPAKRKDSKKKLSEQCRDSVVGDCNHRPKIGSFMSQAREACTLRFLIGASPVCYGVPTGIGRKIGNDYIKG